MKTRIVVIALGVVIVALACAQQTGTSRANLIGTHDLVLVDQHQGDLLAARTYNPESDAFILVGVPSRYVFVTSADTNELRVLENYRTGLVGRGFVRAPNPLETLAIPVLDRPTMLAVDEGRNADGARVTGSYVYAARPGGAEVSVVSVAKHRQLGGKRTSVDVFEWPWKIVVIAPVFWIATVPPYVTICERINDCASPESMCRVL